MSFFRFFVLVTLFLNSLFAHQIEFKGQVLSLSGHQNSAEADVVRIQLTAFDVLQKEALPNAAVAWLKNNRELSIDRKDFPAAALKELEVFSAAPFYPLHLPFSQAPAIKNEGLLCTGTFSLVQTEEQWLIKDLQLNYGKFQGLGTYHWENGTEYFGDWVNGIREGNGTYKRYDGLYYDGQWKNDRFHGKGKLIIPKNFTYEGSFENGQTHGQGKCVWDDGREYEGEWVKGQMEGYGTHTWPKSSAARRFTGWFYQGKPKGEGEFETDGFVDNSTILYNTKNWAVAANNGFGGAYTGSIEFRFTDGNRDSYEGEWKDLALNGSGKALFHNGDIYDGQWRNNKFHGKGMYEWTAQNLPNPANSSAVYSGEWYEGIPVYHGLSYFLKELGISNDPYEDLEDIPPALQEEFKKLIDAWEAEYRSYTFHHERAAAAATGVFFGSGAVAGLSPLLAQVAVYTSGSSLVIAATAAAPYVVAIGAGAAAGYYIANLYNAETQKKEKSVAASSSRVDDKQRQGLIYERWDPNNSITFPVEKPLNIRGPEGIPNDYPLIPNPFIPPQYGDGASVYQYIGKTLMGRFACRQREHKSALKKIHPKLVESGKENPYMFKEREENIPILQLSIKEKIWIGKIGGAPGIMNLQNKVRAVAIDKFYQWLLLPGNVDVYIDMVLNCAVDH